MNTRIQFELSEEKVKELESLMGLAGIVTRKDLFNNALALFEWAVKEKSLGKTIASIDEVNNHYKEIIMPALANVPLSNRPESNGTPVPIKSPTAVPDKVMAANADAAEI